MRKQESSIRASVTALWMCSGAGAASKPLTKQRGSPAGRWPRETNRLSPAPKKKVRMSEESRVVAIILAAARKVLADVQQRCTETLKALDQSDYLVALGGLIGVEENIRYVTVRLMVLREIKEVQNTKKGGKHDSWAKARFTRIACLDNSAMGSKNPGTSRFGADRQTRTEGQRLENRIEERRTGASETAASKEDLRKRQLKSIRSLRTRKLLFVVIDRVTPTAAMEFKE
jgi:hypothetical protein